MKVWITKYALTKGILEGEGKISNKMICMEQTGVFEGWQFPYFHGQGTEWHLSKEQARDEANRMVERKIASLKKQLSKLEELEF